MLSFTISLWTCNLGTEVRRGKSPFDGKILEFPIDLGLTRGEQDAVISLIKEVKAIGPDPDCFYKVTMPDGGRASIDFGGLAADVPSIGFAVEVEILTSELAAFLFKLAQIANMSIRPDAKDKVTILTSPPKDEKVRKRWPDALVVDSPTQLLVLLTPGYEEWKQFVKQWKMESAFETN